MNLSNIINQYQISVFDGAIKKKTKSTSDHTELNQSTHGRTEAESICWRSFNVSINSTNISGDNDKSTFFSFNFEMKKNCYRNELKMRALDEIRLQNIIL